MKGALGNNVVDGLCQAREFSPALLLGERQGLEDGWGGPVLCAFLLLLVLILLLALSHAVVLQLLLPRDGAVRLPADKVEAEEDDAQAQADNVRPQRAVVSTGSGVHGDVERGGCQASRRTGRTMW